MMMMVPSYKGRQERETERQRDRDTETPRLRDTERQRETARQRDREAERQRGQGAGAKNTPHCKQQTKRKKHLKNHSNPWMKKRVWKKRGSQTFNLFKYKKTRPRRRRGRKIFRKRCHREAETPKDRQTDTGAEAESESESERPRQRARQRARQRQRQEQRQGQRQRQRPRQRQGQRQRQRNSETAKATEQSPKGEVEEKRASEARGWERSMHERQKGAARRNSETAAIGPRRLARPFKTSGSGASEKRVVGALDE